MRHKIAGNKLGRNSGLRAATVRDVAKATLINQRICTTKAKAKEARKLVDRLITLGKKGALAHRRRAFAVLCDHALVKDLFEKTAPRFRNRNGGYTRIITLSLRRGDNAQLAYLELTEKDAAFVSKAKSSAIPKVKDLDVSKAETQTIEQVKSEGQPDAPSQEKSPASKPGQSKPFIAKPQIVDKGKPGKKIVGGIKKMFQRKTGSE